MTRLHIYNLGWRENRYESYLPLYQSFLVFLGELLVDPHQVVSVTAGTRAPATRLYTEHVVQHGAHEVVVKERAARVTNHEREDRQPLNILRAAAEQDQFRDRAYVCQHLPMEGEGTGSVGSSIRYAIFILLSTSSSLRPISIEAEFIIIRISIYIYI